jgi:hypothetical protein
MLSLIPFAQAVFDRGKSCLFRMQPSALQARILNAPVYLMVLDVLRPETPVFLGGTSIRVHGDVNELRAGEWIHEERGDYRLHNLVGGVVGQIAATCRITRLGSALDSHLLPSVRTAVSGGDGPLVQARVCAIFALQSCRHACVRSLLCNRAGTRVCDLCFAILQYH